MILHGSSMTAQYLITSSQVLVCCMLEDLCRRCSREERQLVASFPSSYFWGIELRCLTGKAANGCLICRLDRTPRPLGKLDVYIRELNGRGRSGQRVVPGQGNIHCACRGGR